MERPTRTDGFSDAELANTGVASEMPLQDEAPLGKQIRAEIEQQMPCTLPTNWFRKHFETWCDPEWLEFSSVLEPESDANGLYVTDRYNIVRYNLGERTIEPTEEHLNRMQIVADSERQMSLQSVMEEIVFGSGNPFTGPTSSL